MQKGQPFRVFAQKNSLEIIKIVVALLLAMSCGEYATDELLEDDYYKSEFERRVQERLESYNSHSDVKGGEAMNEKVQTPEGEIEQAAPTAESQPPVTEQPAPTDNPAVETTENDTAKEEKQTTVEPAKEMTPQQFEQYNEALRRISKTAKAGIPERYNAFEDAEVKAIVKQQVMAGETPNVKEIAAQVVAKHTPQPEHAPEEHKTTQDQNAEVLSLKAEIALLKAGILPERIEAAKKLFIAEGGDLDKIDAFVAQYPEWRKQEEGVVFTQAPPLVGKTAPSPDPQPVLNDFEKKVKEARKRAGLE